MKGERASLVVLGKFVRHPVFALRYRIEWGEWPRVWKWEANRG